MTEEFPSHAAVVDDIARNAARLGEMVVSKLHGESVDPFFWFLREEQLRCVEALHAGRGLPPHGPIIDL